MTNLDSVKSRDITLPTKVYIFKAIAFSVVMYGPKSLIIRETGKMCWRRLLRVSLIARRSSQSILKEIHPECSSEGLILKLNLQYFGHLM